MENKNIRVLVFPCGSEIGMEIWRSLRYVKNIELIGGSSSNDHGEYLFENHINDIPFISDELFLEKINEVIQDYKVDYIYPAHDDVVTKLAQIQSELNAQVIVTDFKTCELARSKKHTYNFLKDYDFVPKIYDTIDNINEYPVFLKPDKGQGAKDTAIAKDKEEVRFYTEKIDGLIISEYLPGAEFTVDCFTNQNRELLFCGQRTRSRIKSGISVNSKTVPLAPSVKRIAEILNQEIKFKGAWFFQVKLNKKEEYKLMEFAPRIAGTMELYRMCGINFPLLTLYAFQDYNVTIFQSMKNMELDRAFINRYKFEQSKYDCVYIDFDDTIIIKGQVNTEIIAFLYQCQNYQKKIFLITKHIYDIYETLQKYHIDKNLFNDIIHLKQNDAKHKYIKSSEKTIFIDDSFQERYDVHKALNIPVFDLDGVDMLKDWRM